MSTAEHRPPLHWGQPLVMIDRMIECEPHARIVTIKNVTVDDPALGDVERDDPAFPSVMLLEGMSQSAALLFRISYRERAAGTLPLLGFLKATFSERGALPGEIVTYTVRSVKMTSSGGVFEGEAHLGDELIAQAELAFAAAKAQEPERSDA